MKIIEKHINILDYSLSSLWRRKTKNVSVFLIFSIVIFLIASYQMVTSSLTRTAEEILRYAPEIVVQKMTAGRQQTMPQTYQDKASAIFGIRKTVPRIWGYYFDETNGANYTVMAADFKAMPQGSNLQETLADGKMPDHTSKGDIVLGRNVGKSLNLANRRTFSLFRPDLSLKPFHVAGMFRPETDIITGDLMIMSMADARDLFHMKPDFVTDLCVYVANPNEIDNIAKKISAILPDTRVLTRNQILKTYKVVFGWRSGFASVCILTVLAAFAIFAWDKASGLSPEERREIGILKILGWQTSDVLGVKFWESLIISGLAFLAGCSAAFLHVHFFDASLFKPVLVGWSVIHPNLELVPAVSMGDFILIFSFTVLPYLAATVIPAWRSAIVPADSAIR